MSDLAEALQKFVDSRAALEDTVQLMSRQMTAQDERSKKRRKFYWFMAVIVAIVFFIGWRYLLDSSHKNKKSLDGIISITKRFDDCTIPGTKKDPHVCYDNSQKQTIDAIKQLIQSQIKAVSFAAECVVDNQPHVEVCVNEKFAGTYKPSTTTTSTP